MSCESSSNITFEFRNRENTTYLKIRPRSMQFDRKRGKFDYCQAEFSEEVADEINPHLDDDESFLRQPLPVVLLIEEVEVYRLLWVPDGVTFGEDVVHIEFHDPQKYLTRGVVDWKQENVKLREAYNYVFSQRNTDGAQIFNDIKFSVPEEAYETLDAYRSGFFELDKLLDTETRSRIREEGDESGNLITTEGSNIKDLEEENVYNIIDGHYAIDFDKISPWEAITELNEKFGVTTWAAPDGNFWVGSRNPTGTGHVATPDDGRVWKLSDYQVTSPRDPVVRCTIRGGWTDDPSEDWVDNATDLLNLNRGTRDFRIEAVATSETSSPLGQEIFAEKIDAKKDNLEEIAKRKVINKQREQQSGYIELNPELSGDEVSQIRHVQIGDTILTIPPEDDSNSNSMCDTNIETEIFRVVGVQHELSDSGTWNVRIDVIKKLDGILHPRNIDTRLRYYDPHNKEYIEGEQYSNISEQKDDLIPKFI